MKNKDKKFPIILLLLAIIVTFGTFLVSSMHATITGAVIGSVFSGWTLIWVILILTAVFIGLSILHEK